MSMINRFGQDVVHVARAQELPRQIEAEVRPERGERRTQEHTERQAPALVLGREDQEHEEDGQHEDHGDARGLAFLIRHVRPVEAHVGRQDFFRRRFERIERLGRREAFSWHSGQLGRSEQVEPVGELWP
jgi:hypothetical protein